MPTAENARLQYEAGQQAVPMAALTDSGDHMTFKSAAPLWSGRSGHAPVIRPNGLLTGGAVTPDDALANNAVDVAALSCNLNGVIQQVAAGGLTITRPATAVAKVNSLTVNAAGALAVVAGTDGATTAFSETRGAAGGPPFIPVDSIEIGQVRVVSNVAAVITAAQILTLDGLHRERAANPLYEMNHGPQVEGGVEIKAGGSVSFLSALPLIHTGGVAKAVHASYAVPQFADVALASDFVPPSTTHSVQSTPVYGGVVGSTSSTLGQGSFTARPQNGISDPLMLLKNQVLWFKFFPDKYLADYSLSHGKLGVTPAYPAAGDMTLACTISASKPPAEVPA